MNAEELAKVILIDIANDERNIFSPEKTVWDIKKRCEAILLTPSNKGGK